MAALKRTGSWTNIGCVVFGIIATRAPGTCAARAWRTIGGKPCVSSPPTNNVGTRIARLGVAMPFPSATGRFAVGVTRRGTLFNAVDSRVTVAN